MFVLFLVGLLYAWMRSVRMREAVIMKPGRKQFWKKQLLIPHILLAAVMIGMFRFTNFWDFFIYFVVTGTEIAFISLYRLLFAPPRSFSQMIQMISRTVRITGSPHKISS